MLQTGVSDIGPETFMEQARTRRKRSLSIDSNVLDIQYNFIGNTTDEEITSEEEPIGATTNNEENNLSFKEQLFLDTQTSQSAPQINRTPVRSISAYTDRKISKDPRSKKTSLNFEVLTANFASSRTHKSEDEKYKKSKPNREMEILYTNN